MTFNNVFFSLLRVAIGTQDAFLRIPSESEWEELSEMAVKQSLAGVCFFGLLRLGADSDGGFKKIGMGEDLFFAWMGMAAQISLKNEIVNGQCVALHKRLAVDGFRSSILKGQAVATLYGKELRGFRQSGDIDVYVDCGMERAQKYLRERFKADMLDKQGKLPRIQGALLADSIATVAGAVLGTTTVTTYVESSAGVVEGGRTGLTAVVTAGLFLISLIFAPIFLAIPGFCTAPALIVVGFMMASGLLKINFDDIGEALPAYIAAIAMPFFYSISEGISMGVISYTVVNLVAGMRVNGVMLILTVLFVLKYIFI